MPAKVPDALIHQVERSEGLKFKRKPTLGVYKGNKEVAGENYVRRERQGGNVTRVVSARVMLSPVVLSSTKKGLTREGKATLLHELRENVHYQNKGSESEKRVHRSAQSHRREDLRFPF